MTLTGFTMKSVEMSETIRGESFRFFSSVAKEKSANIFAGIIERRDRRNYNTLIHIKPEGTLVKLYRKIHPFSYSGENEHYNAGAKPAMTKIRKWKIGLTICYDLRFPELLQKIWKEKSSFDRQHLQLAGHKDRALANVITSTCNGKSMPI